MKVYMELRAPKDYRLMNVASSSADSAAPVPRKASVLPNLLIGSKAHLIGLAFQRAAALIAMRRYVFVLLTAPSSRSEFASANHF
jgi:hypothetical protein